MISIQALVRNVRTLLQMRREMTNGQHHEEEHRCWSEGRRYPADKRCQPPGMNGVASAKPYGIAKCTVWKAYQLVKANRGAAGIDDETIDDFEQDLSKNLYKLWNRMSSGSYHPPPVKQVQIPKASGGTRKLGVPTVADRVAQTVVKLLIEPKLDPIFHPDSYGYRPGRSGV